MNLRDMIDAVLMRVSLESGIDTQVYADQPIQQLIQSTFNTLFDMFWWEDLYTPADTSFALDGVTGTIVGDISSKLKRLKDLRYVWLGSNTYPLPRAPLRFNPVQVPRPVIRPIPDSTKVFQVVPTNTTDALTIAYRTKPANFQNDTDVIPFDDECMILGTAYDYVNSLGLNPGAEDKLQSKFQNRIQTLMGEEMTKDVSMGGGTQMLPTDWNWF